MSLRIFVTTDNHVGYNELDPIRGEDAAISFDEAMSIAESREVDLVIQGGDLFHLSKPSKQSLYAVMKTLRKRCLSDKNVEFEVLFHDSLVPNDSANEFNHPNFEDPNFNVGIPVFAISGNHDDAGGSRANSLLSPMDVLSMAGLVNHFGRINDATRIVVYPILIEKCGIRLALYGMANVRDERIYRAFNEGKVTFKREQDDPDSWYSILVLHQNHAQHTAKGFLPEEKIPDFINLVIWGHEHECCIDPVENPKTGVKIMQPGSTVATSLSQSEVKQKHVAIITLSPNKLMSVEKIKLNTVRPFALKTVVLSKDASHIKVNDRDMRGKITKWLEEQVEALIEEAIDRWKGERTENESELPVPLPLIRLRAEYSGGYEIENPTRFSNRFVGKVANSNDVLHLLKHRDTVSGRLLPKTSTKSDAPQDGRANGVEQVGELVRQILTQTDLKILEVRGMSAALSKFVEKDEKTALKQGVDNLVESQVEKLLKPVSELTLEEPGNASASEDSINVKSTIDRTTKASSNKKGAARKDTSLPIEMEIDESEPEHIMSSEDESAPPEPTANAKQFRGRRQARSARKSIVLAPSPEEIQAIASADEGEDDSDEMFSPDDFS